jgi:hypothetical protein
MAIHNNVKLVGAGFLLVSLCAGGGAAVAYIQPRLPLWLDLLTGLATIIVIARIWNRHRRNYRFALVRPGVVRSPLGFEVRMSKSRVEYIEGDHVVSWNTLPQSGSVGRFKLSKREIKGWNEPFANEPMTEHRKRQIFKAVLSALAYRQLPEEGKIQPKVRLHRVDSSKGHWGIFVQSVVEASNAENLFVTVILERNIDDEHIESRKLTISVSASQLTSPLGREEVLAQIRNWIETTEGNGSLTIAPR